MTRQKLPEAACIGRLRLPGALCVRERLPPGAAAVLMNQSHTYTDLYLPIAREHGHRDTVRALAGQHPETFHG